MDNVTTYYVVQHAGDSTRYLGRQSLSAGYSWVPKAFAACFESFQIAAENATKSPDIAAVVILPLSAVK